MKKHNDGGSAFPGGSMTELENRGSAWGMSLRDYFAAALLQGNLAEFNHTNDPSRVAAKVYRYADAMIAERNRKEAT